MTTPIGKPKNLISSLVAIIILTILAPAPTRLEAQQKELPEISILTAVNNMAFSAVWVAEQLKYFEQEGVRPKITVAGGGAPCQTAVVGRSAQLCASSTEGLILANLEGASMVAIQAHDGFRNHQGPVQSTVGQRGSSVDEQIRRQVNKSFCWF